MLRSGWERLLVNIYLVEKGGEKKRVYLYTERFRACFEVIFPFCPCGRVLRSAPAVPFAASCRHWRSQAGPGWDLCRARGALCSCRSRCPGLCQLCQPCLGHGLPWAQSVQSPREWQLLPGSPGSGPGRSAGMAAPGPGCREPPMELWDYFRRNRCKIPAGHQGKVSWRCLMVPKEEGLQGLGLATIRNTQLSSFRAFLSQTLVWTWNMNKNYLKIHNK